MRLYMLLQQYTYYIYCINYINIIKLSFYCHIVLPFFHTPTMMMKSAVILALVGAIQAHGHEDIDPDTPDNYIAQHVRPISAD